VDGAFVKANLTNGELLSSLLHLPTLKDMSQRLKITMEGNSVLVNDVNIIIADQHASNGIIHVIEKASNQG
jgi:uncharacterized surface protein with fasciclin (FAS1) repeats